MDGRPYIIPSKGIDAPSLSKTNYGEKLGGKIKKGMTVLAKAHAGDVKERKAKAVAHAKSVEFLASADARGQMERSGKAAPQYKSSKINQPHLDAKAGLDKAKSNASSFPSSPMVNRPSGGSPVISSYGKNSRGRRVVAPQGAPGAATAKRVPKRATGTFAPRPGHGGQSGAQFRSL
jgi:hypothetical protein